MFLRLISLLEKGLFAIAGLLLIASIGLAFYAVVLRYGFNNSIEWIEEASRYLALTSALIATGPVLRKRGHVALDILPNLLSHAQTLIYRIFVGLVGLAVGSGICFWGTKLALQTYGFGMKTGSLQFPLWLPYSIIPLGMGIFVIFCIIEICEAVVALRGGSVDDQSFIPEHDTLGSDL